MALRTPGAVMKDTGTMQAITAHQTHLPLRQNHLHHHHHHRQHRPSETHVADCADKLIHPLLECITNSSFQEGSGRRCQCRRCYPAPAHQQHQEDLLAFPNRRTYLSCHSLLKAVSRPMSSRNNRTREKQLEEDAGRAVLDPGQARRLGYPPRPSPSLDDVLPRMKACAWAA